jgi:tRNA pseudouridine32 synthase/23S rRNA pseudouridine746 synthase/23S rRNA pseudouridine1911/1915/1917 synthase
MQITSESEQTLLDLLLKHFPESSKNTLRSWIKQGRISILGRTLKKASQMIFPKETIVIGKRVRFLEETIPILFEDRDLIVLNKPEGILSVDAEMEKRQSVHAFLKNRFNSQRVYPVHRLDRETSGVMVFAYTEAAREGLKRLFSSHDIEREYLAIIEGHLPETTGSWTSYLRENKNFFVYTTREKDGELAITHYRSVAQNDRYTALLLRLETGKKNQIRVQCQEAGCPVVGDKKYGAKSNPICRVCLHACKLGFVHPVTKKALSFSAPIPESFFELLNLSNLS